MIKLVLFDLDGVLVDTKRIHFDALNEALGERSISEQEHLTLYDGLTTMDKLEKIGLSQEEKLSVYNVKQKITHKRLNSIKENETIQSLFVRLQDEGYEIGICSNAIKRTVVKCLSRIGVSGLCSFYLSADDVDNNKPHPEIYWKAMSIAGVLPEETIIIEDSPVGLTAAQRSGANVIRVNSPEEVNEDLIDKIKGKPMTLKWKDDKLNILIPMAGAGSRFVDAGYSFPKPLIDFNGKPMIQVVVDNLAIDANYIFVVQKEHREKYNLDSMLGLIAPNCKIVEVDGVTEGAACTTLLAKEYINNDAPLLIANSDQYVEWNSLDFMYKMREGDYDGGIVTFKSTHPKWSYAKTDGLDMVTEVAEKNPISDNATVGFYYWKHGKDYVKYCEDMIVLGQRVNNEFYVCPVYNNAIRESKSIKSYEVTNMWGLGTPEDLENARNTLRIG
jgi:beta-phosphoglucomutase-like phosphatase (HAD superfamily)/dTDP-glucose pyrophosphorylase